MGFDEFSVLFMVMKEDDGYYYIWFVFCQIGEYRVMVKYGGKEVFSSLYVICICDFISMKVKVMEMEQMRMGYFV